MTEAVAAERLLCRLTDTLVDDHVGLLRSVEEIRSPLGAPNFFHYSAWLSNTAAVGGQLCSLRTGSAAVDRHAAALRAITDAIACYCAAYRFQPVMPPVCGARDAPFTCVSPDEFDWFSPEQYGEPDFPWVPFDTATRVHWTEAYDPLRDKPVFVPAAFVFLPHTLFREQGEVGIAPVTSTGLACHCSPAAAAVEAVSDAVECDALSLLWLGRRSAAQVRVETLSDPNYELVARFERTGGAVTIFQIEGDVALPCFLAVFSGSTKEAPARMFAAGTDLSPERGVRKSLEMLAHVHQYCELLHSQMAPLAATPGFPDIVDQTSHLRFWCNHANAALADFLFASDQRVELDELEDRSTGHPERDLDVLIRHVSQTGHRVLLADLTTPDVGELGLSVLRAVIPGLCPLLYGSRTRPLGSARLQRLTQSPQAVPHPFPRRGVLA